MTKPSPDVLEAEKDKYFVTDAELIRRLGVPEKEGRAALHVFDREKHRGFPQKQAIWGDRRYWPAVKAFLDRTCGVTMTVQPNQKEGRHG